MTFSTCKKNDYKKNSNIPLPCSIHKCKRCHALDVVPFSILEDEQSRLLITLKCRTCRKLYVTYYENYLEKIK